jgi:hypothetical protein
MLSMKDVKSVMAIVTDNPKRCGFSRGAYDFRLRIRAPVDYDERDLLATIRREPKVINDASIEIGTFDSAQPGQLIRKEARNTSMPDGGHGIDSIVWSSGTRLPRQTPS